MSVRQFERQDYPERELIVVDTGRASSWLEGMDLDLRSVRFLQLPDELDAAAACDYACGQARGEIIASWNSEDWHGASRLSRQVQPLREGTADLCAVDADEFLDLSEWKLLRCPEEARGLLQDEVTLRTLVFRLQFWKRLSARAAPFGPDGRSFLEDARRRGARIAHCAGKGLYRVVWLDRGARDRACGGLNPSSWPVSRSLGLPAADRRFYETMRPSSRAGRVRNREATHVPLVSCIMPTADRRPFVKNAIGQFLAQDYPARELIIVDDGIEPVQDLVADNPLIRYVRPQKRMTVGAKRNLACRQAQGEIIAHWDDDDWMAPWRLSYQLGALLEKEADVCGLDRLFFWDPALDEAWHYVYPPDEKPWLAGGSLLYRHELWERRPFIDVDVGEDNDFVWSDAPKRIESLQREDFYVATLHPGNTSPKLIEPSRWFSADPQLVESMLGAQAAEFRGLFRRYLQLHADASGMGMYPPARRPNPASVPPVFSEIPVRPFTAARKQDLDLVEFAAFNYAKTVPWMRRWELPFALFQARLDDTMAVLDCTINPADFERWIAELYPHVLYRHWNPVTSAGFVPPSAVPDESFDRVFCINTLEHLTSPQREEMVATLAAKLKPGGSLVTTVDYYFDSSWASPDWIGTGLLRADREEVFNGFNRITVRALQELCQRHGLQPTDTPPGEPGEGDEALYLNPPPLVHATVGGVFCKELVRSSRSRKVLLALLTWNTREVSTESLEAHIREARMLIRLGHEAAICVVDNGSSDGTTDELRGRDAGLDIPHRFILNSENLGNSRARNQTIDYMLQSGADYVLFTDGDVELVPFSSFVMLRYLESCGRRVGCLGSYSFQCTPHRDHTTPALYSLAGLGLHASDVLAWTQYGMFRRSMFEDGIRFEEGGPFGEPGHGLEDVDLAFQMNEKGYQNHYFTGMCYLHRNLSSSVPMLQERGLDPTERYYRRKEFLLQKWENVPAVAAGPLAWVRSARAPWPGEMLNRQARVRFAPGSEEIEVPREVLDWVDRSVSDMMDRKELIALAAVLASFAWSGKELVVEIGAFIGTTTVMMAKVLEILGHRPTILSIDPFERCQPDNLNPQGSYVRYLQNICGYGVDDRCLALAGFSVNAAPAVPDRIGVLVVDGAHHYEAVLADLQLYAPKLVAGGYVFIDDYCDSYPGVIRATDHFLAQNPGMQILAREHYVILRREASAPDG